MGYNIYQGDSSFMIRKEHFPALIAAAQKMCPHKFDSMSSVREVFEYFRFSVQSDEHGNLSEIEFTGQKAGSEDKLFELVAPYVEAGSYISFAGEDNELFQYSFNGKDCETVYPLLLWPECPSEPKKGMKRYILPFSISGDIILEAQTEQKAKEIAGNLSVETILSRVWDLVRKDKPTYLHINQIKQMEE